MKIAQTRSFSYYFHLLIGMAFLAPQGFVSAVFAQDDEAGGKSFGAQMVDSLGIFPYAFILMILGGISLIIYNGIAIVLLEPYRRDTRGYASVRIVGFVW